MAWLIPTALDLRASIGSDEADLLAAKSAADGQDVQGQQMARTVDLVRAAARRAGVAMGPPGTIPQEALQPWAEIAASDAFRRLNVEPKTTRETARKEAWEWLNKLAENKVHVVPYGFDEQMTGGQSPRINPRVRTFGRGNEDGI